MNFHQLAPEYAWGKPSMSRYKQGFRSRVLLLCKYCGHTSLPANLSVSSQLSLRLPCQPPAASCLLAIIDHVLTALQYFILIVLCHITILLCRFICVPRFTQALSEYWGNPISRATLRGYHRCYPCSYNQHINWSVVSLRQGAVIIGRCPLSHTKSTPIPA